MEFITQGREEQGMEQDDPFRGFDNDYTRGPEALFRVEDKPESDAPLSVYMELNDDDPAMRAALSGLAVGQSVTLGGGAWATFTMTRVR